MIQLYMELCSVSSAVDIEDVVTATDMSRLIRGAGEDSGYTFPETPKKKLMLGQPPDPILYEATVVLSSAPSMGNNLAPASCKACTHMV